MIIKSKQHLQQIEKIVKFGNVSYIEATIDYCEKNNLEIDYIASIIRKNAEIKSKVEQEALKLKSLK